MPVPQSAIPAYAVGALCITGGFTGYLRTRSLPSLIAGVGYVHSTPVISDSPHGIRV